jgi:hypothetical protein
MRLPRMGTRTWMLVVGVVPVVMSAVVWQKRCVAWRGYCTGKVGYHARLARSWRNLSEGHAREAETAMELADDAGASEKRRRWLRYVAKSNRRGAKYLGTVAEYHVQMSEKWTDAANSLWLSAEPDPPEP